MSAIIYRITNQVNGKCYIGQTIQKVGTRWTRHCYAANRGSQCYIHRAIRKYGPHAFAVEVLEETTTEQLNDRERYWIAELRPAYNMTEGGEHCSHSIETRQKLSASKRGENNPFYGKHLTPEHREKIHKAFEGKKNHFYGKKHSLESREKMGASKRGKKLTEEHKAKLSALRRGKKVSPETLAKRREARRKAEASRQ